MCLLVELWWKALDNCRPRAHDAVTAHWRKLCELCMDHQNACVGEFWALYVASTSLRIAGRYFA
jgi:hypothetical protein